MSTRASDDFHALIIAFDEANAAFNAADMAHENHELVSDLDHAIKAIETTKLVATTYAGAIAALRTAASDLDNFANSELVEPLVKGALAYFEKAEAASGPAVEHAMNMVSGLSLAGINKDIQWLAIYDAINMAEQTMSAICNRAACIDDGIGMTAAGEYIDAIVDFLAWERTRVVNAARVFLSEMKDDPEVLNKAILAHDVTYSEFGFADISAQVASMSARYEEYKARRALIAKLSPAKGSAHA